MPRIDLKQAPLPSGFWLEHRVLCTSTDGDLWVQPRPAREPLSSKSLAHTRAQLAKALVIGALRGQSMQNVVAHWPRMCDDLDRLPPLPHPLSRVARMKNEYWGLMAQTTAGFRRDQHQIAATQADTCRELVQRQSLSDIYSLASAAGNAMHTESVRLRGKFQQVTQMAKAVVHLCKLSTPVPPTGEPKRLLQELNRIGRNAAGDLEQICSLRGHLETALGILSEPAQQYPWPAPNLLQTGEANLLMHSLSDAIRLSRCYASLHAELKTLLTDIAPAIPLLDRAIEDLTRLQVQVPKAISKACSAPNSNVYTVVVSAHAATTCSRLSLPVPPAATAQ